MRDPLQSKASMGFSGTANEVFVDACRYFLGGVNGPDPYIRITEDETSPDKGKTMMEYPILFSITNPRNRLIYAKDIDIYNLVGQFIWMMSGSEAVGPISFYNDVARRFVDEGSNPTRLRASWGSRLFGTGAVDRAISLLRVSPGTRRAIVPVLTTEDVGYQSRNLPCLAGVQWTMQGEVLNCYATMRAQALVGVFPYDIFILTMLHEYVSMRVEIPLGSYVHFAPTCGVRENEIPIMREATEIPMKSGMAYATIPMKTMEPLAPGDLALFHHCERVIRNTLNWPHEALALPGYWQGFLHITYAKKHNEPDHILYADKTFPEGFLSKCREVIRRRPARPA